MRPTPTSYRAVWHNGRLLRELFRRGLSCSSQMAHDALDVTLQSRSSTSSVNCRRSTDWRCSRDHDWGVGRGRLRARCCDVRRPSRRSVRSFSAYFGNLSTPTPRLLLASNPQTSPRGVRVAPNDPRICALARRVATRGAPSHRCTKARKPRLSGTTVFSISDRETRSTQSGSACFAVDGIGKLSQWHPVATLLARAQIPGIVGEPLGTGLKSVGSMRVEPRL